MAKTKKLVTPDDILQILQARACWVTKEDLLIATGLSTEVLFDVTRQLQRDDRIRSRPRLKNNFPSGVREYCAVPEEEVGKHLRTDPVPPTDWPGLPEHLREWTHWDRAMFELALITGLMTQKDVFNGNTKHVFWSNNPIGNVLSEMLWGLYNAGVLEGKYEDMEDEKASPDQVRWNPNFKGTWEDGRGS